MTAVDDLLADLPPGQTHEVVNQSGATPDHDAFSADATLRGLVSRWDLGWAADRSAALGQVVGARATEQLAHLANEHGPELRLFDRFGHRVDEVDFHPAYHELMRLAYTHEVHSLAWTGDGPNPHTARAVLSYLWNQAELGESAERYLAFASLAKDHPGAQLIFTGGNGAILDQAYREADIALYLRAAERCRGGWLCSHGALLGRCWLSPGSAHGRERVDLDLVDVHVGRRGHGVDDGRRDVLGLK